MTPFGAVAAPRAAWRVVVVDDNPDDRAEIRRMLLRGSDRRYHFEEAETGRAALELIAAHPDGPPRCLLLDYYLPDMDALDALAALSGPDGLTACPVVVMTGAVGAEAGKAVLHAGAQDYIGKDWLTPPGITRVIENAVDRFELTRQLRERDAAIRESEARLRLALEASDTGLWTWDIATDAVTYNAQCYRILGLEPESFDHTHSGCLALIHPDDRPRVEAACDRAIAEGSLFEAEFRVARPDGGTVWVMHRARADYDSAGRPVRLLGTTTDVTHRKQAEEAARRRLELQAQLATIAETTPGVIYSYRVAPDGTRTVPFCNPSVLDVFGIPPEVLARSVEPLEDRIHPDDRAAYMEAVRACIARMGNWHTKYRYIHPTKGLRWIEGWASPRPDTRGGTLWHGFAMDVTDREQAEASRRESERMARSILDSMSSLVAVVDESARVLAANRSWHGSAALHGPERTPGGDICACELIEHAGPELCRAIREVLASRLDSAEVDCSLRAAGGPRHYVARVVPFSGDGPRRAVVSFQDITELKAIERQLRDEKARFEDLADNINQFAWMADLDGRIYWYNRRWYDYTGATEAESLGHGWTRFAHPDHVDRVLRSVSDRVARASTAPDDDTPWEETFPFRSRSGEYRWFLARAMPLRDESGRIARWFGSNTDITERKAMEAALTENDRRKDVFLAMLGHELRNPLATIRVASEVLGSPQDAFQADWARDVIHDQVDHLARLLDDLLDVSRITRGAVRIEPQPIDAVAVVHRAFEAMRPLILARSHTFDLDLGLDALPLEADPDRLEQVVSNLIANAAKYTPPRRPYPDQVAPRWR